MLTFADPYKYSINYFANNCFFNFVFLWIKMNCCGAYSVRYLGKYKANSIDTTL